MNDSPRRFRSAQADRMGFAWDEDEWPDMTLHEALRIVADSDNASREGKITNEDTGTILYARNLIAAHKRPPS